eukprot:9008519-Heterocapsa_arctica.AAC.1
MGGHLPHGMRRTLQNVADAALRPLLGGPGVGCRCGRLRAHSAASTLGGQIWSSDARASGSASA